MGDPDHNGRDQAGGQAQQDQPIASSCSASESSAQVGGLVTGKTSGVPVAGAWERHKAILTCEHNDRPPARGYKSSATIVQLGLAVVREMQQDTE